MGCKCAEVRALAGPYSVKSGQPTARDADQRAIGKEQIKEGEAKDENAGCVDPNTRFETVKRVKLRVHSLARDHATGNNI